MWARRVLRTGDVIASIFNYPISFIRWCVVDNYGRFSWGSTVASFVVIGFFIFVVFGAAYIMTYMDPASARNVKEAMNDSPCVSQQLIEKQTKNDLAIRNVDIDQAYKTCEYWAEHEIAKEKQKKAMGLK